MDDCIECGGVVFGEGLRCEDCDFVPEETAECSLCGREFDPTHEGEYDTCGPCLEEMEDEVADAALVR